MFRSIEALRSNDKRKDDCKMMEENRIWEASWIWVSDRIRSAVDGDHELVYFRRTFEVPADTACQLTVDVTADSRYRLFINGKSVSAGPCKGNDREHYYETVDISEHLTPGINVLAAQVLHYTHTVPWKMGISGPLSLWRSGCGGFLAEGTLCDKIGNPIERLHTDSRWKCSTQQGYKLVASELVQWLGGLEQVEGSGISHGWQSVQFEDSGWSDAVAFMDSHDRYGQLAAWPLYRRPIPQLEEIPTRFKSIVRYPEAVKVSMKPALRNYAAKKQANFTVVRLKPGERLIVELDAGELTTGYPELAISGGSGGKLRLLYAECYEPEHSGRGANRVKEIRDVCEGGKLVGDYDSYCPAGIGTMELPEKYEPFWFRTFRYVRLEVEASEEPLCIHSFGYRRNGYPLAVDGHFECSDADLNKLWGLSLRTLKNCMHETYEDCPYYEQLQYTMDTRLQMVFTYNLSTDDRLARRAIHDFHSSQLPSGMLQCRYPSMLPQVIPSFSLYWIFMLADHYRHFGNLLLVERYYPTMLGVLGWFERLMTDEDMIGVTPPVYWSFIDWVDGWSNGVPPEGEGEALSIHSLMLAAALTEAAWLLREIGWADAAAEMETKQQQINEAVNRLCWSNEDQLYRNSPKGEGFSQHAQIWAVLSGAIQGEEAVALMRRTLADETLPKVSLPAVYELFRALERTGLYDEYAFGQWDRWRVLLKLRLTTLPEKAHGTPRSDCHAWSALPLSEFPRACLGVLPGEPGFRRITIRPRISGMEWARGTVVTPAGPVYVFWRHTNGRFRLEADCPANVPITIECPDGRLFHSEIGGVLSI